MSSNELKSRIQKYRELKVFIEQLSQEMDEIKKELITELEEQQTEKLLVDTYKISYTDVKSERLDTKTFKSENPELANRYIKVTTSKRFTVA